MLKVKKEGILLSRTDHSFENEGVLNPAVIKVGNNVHMFYRALHHGNSSSIGYCKFEGPLTIVERHENPIISGEFEYESQGVEDPRIVKIDNLYYLTYSAYNGINALGALATSSDLKKFEKQGIIVPQIPFIEFKKLAGTTKLVHRKYFREVRQFKPTAGVFMWDKNVIFFPRRIRGNLYFLHRIRPGIQLVIVNQLSELTKEFWEEYLIHFNDHILLESKFEHEASYIGGGCPPIETDEGWLLIYHGVRDTPEGYVYSACAALMDLHDPTIEISRLPNALFSPTLKWEIYGVVDNVVFPTGTALFGDTLYIYYGAADKRIACTSVSFIQLMKELLKYRII